jgi:ankyrin repeat protein
LCRKACPNVVNSRGLNAFHIAAIECKLEVLMQMQSQHQASQVVLDESMIKASLKGHFSVVEYLLKEGANINYADKKGWTCLMYAALDGLDSTVVYLLKSGAEVNKQNCNGSTALMKAA